MLCCARFQSSEWRWKVSCITRRSSGSHTTSAATALYNQEKKDACAVTAFSMPFSGGRLREARRPIFSINLKGINLGSWINRPCLQGNKICPMSALKGIVNSLESFFRRRNIYKGNSLLLLDLWSKLRNAALELFWFPKHVFLGKAE